MIKGKILKTQKLSKRFHNIFQFTRKTAKVELRDGSHHTFVRHVLETGPATSILPYFFDEKTKKWHVVMVNQYRPAVDYVSLEAPGGLLEEGSDVRKEMARELLEEAGVSVNPKSIRIVDVQHLAASFCDQVVYLGIVDLRIKDKKKLIESIKIQNGSVGESEFTEVVVLPLDRLLKNKNLVKYTLARYQLHDLARRFLYQGHKKKK